MKGHAPISAFPRPRLARLLASSHGGFDPDCLSLHGWGRDALYWGLRGLHANPETTIWMPAFHCGVEVQAAIDAGMNVAFYPIRDDLTVDLPTLEREFTKQPGPLLVIHYFGWPQPGLDRLAELAERHRQVLIEDCAHALFSRSGNQDLGRTGPMAIFSFYKSLGVFDGGGLRIDAQRLRALTGRPFQPPIDRRSAWPVYRAMAKSGLGRLLGPSVRCAYRRWRYGEGVEREEEDVEGVAGTHPLLKDGHDYQRGMSAISRRLMAASEANHVAEARRSNWGRLHQRLSGVSGYHPIFEDLPKGAVPLFLPIRTPMRRYLRGALRSEGIETFVFGAFAHPALTGALAEESAPLRQTLFGLPVHQNLSDAQVERVAERTGVFLGRGVR